MNTILLKELILLLDNMKNIEPTDKNGHFHGYQEWYYSGVKLTFRCKYIHGNKIGYVERHGIKETNFYIR